MKIKKEELITKGTLEFLLNIADNLPYDEEMVPYHIHYDSFSFPQFLNEELLDIIFEAIS